MKSSYQAFVGIGKVNVLVSDEKNARCEANCEKPKNDCILHI
jgi:hypothetical protein